jgi:pimeloyl-ACP methyl ester carboxylesterase
MWRHAMAALAAAGHRALALDFRGFGGSERTPRGYRKPELAADVLAVLDALALDRVAIVGHDWGGLVALLVALDHPERVTRLVLLNTGHPFPLRDARTARAAAQGLWYMPLLGAPLLGPALVRHGVVRRALQRSGAIRSWTAEETARYLDDLDPHATQRLYGTFVAGDTRGRRHGERLTVPTLHLHGDADAAVRLDLLRGLDRHADDYRLELLPGAGHFCVEDAPAIVQDRLVRFLAPDL